MVRKPACASRSICHTISALPPASRRGFGRESVSGRIRSPRPAAKIIAFVREVACVFIGVLARSEGVTDVGSAAFELVEQLRERRKRPVTFRDLARIGDES